MRDISHAIHVDGAPADAHRRKVVPVRRVQRDVCQQIHADEARRG